MLRLNGGPDYDPTVERLVAAPSIKKKPTVRIRRLFGSGKLKNAASIPKDREKAKKTCD